MKFFTKRELNKAIAEVGVEKAAEVSSRREALTRIGLISTTGALFYACGKGDDDTAVADTSCKETTDKALAEAKAKWEKDAKSATDKASMANKAADAELLNAALALEHEAVAVYSAAAGLPIWTGGNAPTYLEIAKAFAGHHATHAADLAKVIKDLGGTPVTAKSATDYFTANGISNPAALGLGDVLKFALSKELGAAQAYASLAAKLKIADDAGLFARLAADEASHYAIFRAAFTFLDPTVATEAAYKAATPNLIIPGAYPEAWTKP